MMRALKWRDLGAGLFVLAVGVVFLFWAQVYPPRMSELPKFVAWITIVLALIDVAAQFDTPVGRMLRRVTGLESPGAGRRKEDAEEPTWSRIAGSMAWLAGYVLGVFVLGFLLATLLYVFLYMYFHGGKTLRASALGAVVTPLVIWFAFEYLFHYPLYAGLIFSAR